jgi:carbon-monoxide dehydrogenase medium subunit
MTLPEIKYHTPQSLAEAFRMLNELENIRVVAGGTDLLVNIKEGLIEPKNLVSLQKIDGLRGIEQKNNKIRIGAMVTPQEISSHPLIAQHLPALADASRSMGSSQIRSMATLGGNIASAVPSADLPPSLIAADATVRLECLDASREISLSEFFTGPRETVCGAGELLVSVLIPLPPPSTGISYQKLTLREANALAVASVASRLTLKNGIIKRAVVVLGAVAPIPVMASKTSQFLCEKKPSEKLFQSAASIAKEETKPISDIRGTIWFRKELIQVLTQRALVGAWERARGKPERAE